MRVGHERGRHHAACQGEDGAAAALKAILINDDFTPREFVVTVLKKVFRMSEAQAYPVMLTAHRRGACVVAVFAKDIAESKAAEATDLGRSAGHPLSFSTEPEE